MSQQGLEIGSPAGIRGGGFQVEGTARAKARGQEGALLGLSHGPLERVNSLTCGRFGHKGNPDDRAAVDTTTWGQGHAWRCEPSLPG